MEIQMSAPNGRANGCAIDNPSEQVVQAIVPAPMRPSTGPHFSINEIKHFIAELEVPFDPAVIEWRVNNTTKSGKLRGQVIPYADPRAYTDRLNSLFTPPAGHGNTPSIPALTSNGSQIRNPSRRYS
jgi:hypothetical protein